MAVLIISHIYHIARKFSGVCGLVVYLHHCQIKTTKISYLHIIRMAIPYQTAKLKSANIFVIAIWSSTAKFSSRQYFQLCGIYSTWQSLIHSAIAIHWDWLVQDQTQMTIFNISQRYWTWCMRWWPVALSPGPSWGRRLWWPGTLWPGTTSLVILFPQQNFSCWGNATPPGTISLVIYYHGRVYKFEGVPIHIDTEPHCKL